VTRRAKAKPPGHGGAREGAGRPATGRTVKPLQLHLPPDVVAMIDAARGGESRSRWVAELVRKFSAPSSA
jgi:hypothetical protein